MLRPIAVYFIFDLKLNLKASIEYPLEMLSGTNSRGNIRECSHHLRSSMDFQDLLSTNNLIYEAKTMKESAEVSIYRRPRTKVGIYRIVRLFFINKSKSKFSQFLIALN